MMLTPRCRRPSDFRMSKPTLISSSGSAASETRMVSPMPAHKQIADADGRLHRAGSQRPRLGDAEVQRAIHHLRQLLVGGDGHEGVGRLHADLVLVEVEILQDAGVDRARSRPWRPGRARRTFSSRMTLQRAGIHADTDGAAVVAGGLHHIAHPVLGADIAGIDAKAGRARLRRFDAAFVVKVDVGHERRPWPRLAMVLQGARLSPHPGRRRARYPPPPPPAAGSGRWWRPRRQSAYWSSTAR